jgi:hypothetical protein
VGWVDDHTLAFVYDALEIRRAQSPIYLTGETESAVEIVTCNAKHLDCSPILRRFEPNHTLVIKEFPEGGWSKLD